jgi:beta-glucanase (GH16 family)
VTAVLMALVLAAAAPAPEPPGPGWQLVWADDFDGPRLDARKWGFDVDCWGGGNDERQCYTRSRRNAAIVDGALVITAHKERVSGPSLPPALRGGRAPQEVTRAFSSARLSTRGKASWRFGRIEVRAQLPHGQGTWPAIWMLPETNAYGPWAASGEIDILEAVNLGVPCAGCVGGREDHILGTLHFGGKWPGNRQTGDELHYPAVLDGFHVFAVDWTPDRITWLVDGKPWAWRAAHDWFTTGTSTAGAPFDKPFHLVLNLAIGGRLPEGRGLGGVAADGWPRQLRIDWVQVWQQPENGAE